MARTKNTETKKRVATKGRAEEPNASSMSHSKCSQCCQLFKNFKEGGEDDDEEGKVHKLLEQLKVASDESDYEDDVKNMVNNESTLLVKVKVN